MNKTKTIPLFRVFMPKSVKKPLLNTLFSGYIGQGSKVEGFEKSLALYLKNPYVLTLNSATSALHLALRLANVGPGDEVITTPLTCTATNWPILSAGAKIVWADIDPKTANIDPRDIARKITSKTKAIIAVDWGGQPVDIDKIRKIAFRKSKEGKVKIPIIEDAAHAFGSVYKAEKIGKKADFTCFSFQAIKHLTTVDGGLLVVKNRKDYRRGKLLRWYGIDREANTGDSRIEVDVFEWGYKFHMNDIAATIGLEQLKYIDKILAKHRENAKFFDKNLSNLARVKPLLEQKQTVSSYWLYTLRVADRDNFRNYMYQNGIVTSQVHRRNDTHPVVRNFRRKLPQMDILDKEMICIPVGWWLSTSERQKIVNLIKKW